jgi:hypothetical protein
MTASVRAEIDFASVRVYIADTLHLDFRRADYRGLQSWQWKGGYWAIEIYLADVPAPMLVEYEREETWRAVLDALKQVKLSGT